MAQIDWERRRKALGEHIDINLCYECSKCSGGCALHRHDPSFDPKEFVLLLGLGHDIPHDLVWLCGTCDFCSECPQGLSPRKMLTLYRNQLWENDERPEDIEKMWDCMLETGWISPGVEKINKIRERLLLPPLREVALEEELND